MADKQSISIVLNIHREEKYIEKSLLSLSIAAEKSRQQGHFIELVAVFDNSDANTLKAYRNSDRTAFNQVKEIQVSNGNLALSRNDGVSATSGSIISIADADDLVSQNSIISQVNKLLNSNRNTLVFNEFVIGFDEKNFVGVYRDLEFVNQFAFFDSHPYVSRVTSFRESFLDNSYVATSPISPFHFEDWHFNATCFAKGFNFTIAKETALYYRQRPSSIMGLSRRKATADDLAPCVLFEPDKFIQTYEKYHAEVLDGQFDLVRRHPPINLIDRIADDIKDIHKIESKICLDAVKRSPYFYNDRYVNTHLGLSYYKIARLLRDKRYKHIFLLPYQVPGGADLYIRQICHSIYRNWPTDRTLLLLGEDTSVESLDHLSPANCDIINLRKLCPNLTLDQLCFIGNRIIQNVGLNDSCLHLRQSVFADRFCELYGNLICNNFKVFYFFMTENINKGGQNKTTLPKFLVNNVGEKDTIISDNKKIFADPTVKQSFPKTRMETIYAKTSLTNISDCFSLDSTTVLWASRLDFQKRISLLVKISDKLEMMNSEFDIHAFGTKIINVETKLKESKNLSYKGTFSNFSDVLNRSFFCFIYTSFFDGLPNILLEVAQAGIPIIAPDVGGISEIIIDNETGFLIPDHHSDEVMAHRYIEAIFKLKSGKVDIKDMIRKARERSMEMTDSNFHIRRVRAIFDKSMTRQ